MEELSGGVPAISGVERFPPIRRRPTRAECGIKEDRQTVGGVSVSFLNDTAAVRDAGDVPVGILCRVESFVEGAVCVGVTIPEHEVVDVTEPPYELAFGISRTADSLFDDLPHTRLSVVKMPRFREHSATVAILGGSPLGRVVGIFRHEVATFFDRSESVPGVVEAGVADRRIGRLGNRRHVAGRVVGGGDPAWAGGFGDVGDFVDRVVGSVLDQIPGAVAGVVLTVVAPVAGRVQAPAFGEGGRAAGDRRLASIERAALHVLETMNAVVPVELVEGFAQAGGDHVLTPDAIPRPVVAVLDAIGVGAAAVVVPAVVFDSAEAVEAGVDIPRVRVVRPRQIIENPLDVRLGVVRDHERPQAQVAVLRQDGAAVFDGVDPATCIGDAPRRAVVVADDSAVGVRQARGTDRVGAAVGVAVLHLGSAARVDRSAVRLVVGDELAEVVVRKLHFIDDAAAADRGVVVAGQLETHPADFIAAGQPPHRAIHTAPQRRDPVLTGTAGSFASGEVKRL